MIQLAGSIAIPGRGVVKTAGHVFRLSDRVREQAAREVQAGLDGVTCKRIREANVPGAGVAYLSRIQHGDAGNPLFRLASLFVMGRILGVPKERFQRWIDWLQSKLDEAYRDKPLPSLEEVLANDSALDPRDDHPRFQAVMGCPAARRQLLEEKRRQLAYGPTVILVLEQAEAR